MRNNSGLARVYILFILVGIILALTAQACGGLKKESLVTPSDKPVETAIPTVLNTPEPATVIEPTATPTPELTSTVEVSPTGTSTPVPISYINVQDLKLKLDSGQSFFLLDVRMESSYNVSHIDGAISVPLSKLEEHYNEVPEDLEIIIYTNCR